MKSTIILKPLEYSIVATGQSWRQGEKIKGVLQIKNHSAESVEISLLEISLVIGNFKKIKTKDKKAWELLSEAQLSQKLSLKAAEEKEFLWEFTLPEDCPITDKNGSVYLTFFDKEKSKEDFWPAGQLELVIEPKLIITQFLSIMESFIRFKVVQKKFSKGMVETKLNPPTSKDLSHVESLLLRIKEVNKTLELEYIFTMNVFETVAGNVMTQKKIRQIDQKLFAKEYCSSPDYADQDFIIKKINEVIKEITPKFLL